MLAGTATISIFCVIIYLVITDKGED